MTGTRGLPVVDLSGSPREWGLQHGKAAKRRIAANVALYRERFAQWTKASPEEIWRRAVAYRDVIEASSPDYMEALHGIADGSRQDVTDIVAVNVRYEILYSAFADRGMEREAAGVPVAGCTAFAIDPSRSANGHLLLGQNWDWMPEVQGILVQARAPDGASYLAFTEAGVAGPKIGLNAHGLGLAVNGLVSNEDRWSRLRKPFHVRCWEILRASDLDAAADAAIGEPRSCSSNYVLAQAGTPARLADLEAAPNGSCRLEATDGFLVHTNHFSDQDKLGIWQPLAEDRPSTFHRYERIQSLLQARVASGGKVSVADLKDMLSDHTDEPFSICRHGDPVRSPEERFATVVSVIMDLDAREMFVAPGPPCTARYRRVQLFAPPGG